METLLWIIAFGISLWLFEKFQTTVSLRTFCWVGIGVLVFFWFGSSFERKAAAWVLCVFLVRFAWYALFERSSGAGGDRYGAPDHSDFGDSGGGGE
jgi:hypothetical protein